jgi:hypothetical protein
VSECRRAMVTRQGTLSERDVEIRRLRKLIRPGVGIPLTPPAGDPPTHRYTSLSADRCISLLSCLLSCVPPTSEILKFEYAKLVFFVHNSFKGFHVRPKND